MELINFFATDGVELNGVLYTSQGQPSKKIILALHGMTSNCF